MSTHVHNTSSRPGLFLSAGPEFLERGEFFKQNFPRDRPSKKLVSIFSPCRSSDKIQRLRFRHKSTSVRLSSSIATLGQALPEQSSFCSFIGHADRHHMFREGTLCKLNKVLCLMIDRSEEEHVAWKDEQGERVEGSNLADTGPPRTELDETLMLVEELKTFAEVEQDIDSGTDQHDADDTHRWNEDEESDRVTEPTFYEHNAQDEPVHPLLAFLSPLLDEEEPLAWKIESDQGEGHDSNAGQPRKEVEETSILVEELKTRVCRVYQTFTEVEKNVDSGTDQWEEETESTITQKVQDRAAEPTVNEDKAQDEPVSAIEAGWQMDTPGQQRPTESDGYEKMISAIVGEQMPTRTPRAPVSRDVVIPATVERLRALKWATYNMEINLMGSY